MMIYQNEGYSDQFVNDWLTKHPDDPVISGYMDAMREIEA